MPAKLISSFLPLFANNFDCNEIDKGPQVMNCLFRFLSISAVFTWVAGQSDNVSAWGVEDELALNRAVNIENIVLVNSSSDFYEAWKGAEGQDIVLLLQNDIDFSDAWWAPGAPLTAQNNQTVVIRGALQQSLNLSTSPDVISEAGATAVSWGQQDSIFLVEPGGSLMVDGIVSKDVAPYLPWKLRTQPEVDVMALALHPSGLFTAGSEFIVRNSQLEWLNLDCSQERMESVAWRIGLAARNNEAVAQIGNTSFYVQGKASLATAVVKAGDWDQVVGEVDIIIDSVMMNCVASPLAGGLPPEASSPNDSLQQDSSPEAESDGGLPAWVWVLIALGAAAVLFGGVCAVTVVGRRRRRAWARNTEPPLPVVVTPPTSTSRSMQPESGAQSNQTGIFQMFQRSSSPKLFVGDSSGKLDLPFGVGGGLGVMHQLQVAWSLRIGAIQGLELNSIIDRGGFATVFHGRWNGATVAVKLVEHTALGGDLKQLQREAELAMSVSHPNVVNTYKVSTLSAADINSMQQQEAETGQKSWCDPKLTSSPQGSALTEAIPREAAVAVPGTPKPSESHALGSSNDEQTGLDDPDKIMGRAPGYGPLEQKSAGPCSCKLAPGNNDDNGKHADREQCPSTAAVGNKVNMGEVERTCTLRKALAAPIEMPDPECRTVPISLGSEEGTDAASSPLQLQQALGARDSVKTRSVKAEHDKGSLGAERLCAWNGLRGQEEQCTQEHADAVPAATLIVMEYCDRGSLEGAMQRRDLLWTAEGEPHLVHILRLLIDVALGLDYLHSVGIVHGDIKAGNVLLKSMGHSRRGYCGKLADFGLSRMLERAQTSAHASVLGTASYMAPELMTGGKISKAADIYSFGLLMWECWEGRHAFESLPLPMLSYQVAHRQHRPPIPQCCPVPYINLMCKCWQQHPKTRPPSAQVLEQLKDMLSVLLEKYEGEELHPTYPVSGRSH